MTEELAQAAAVLPERIRRALLAMPDARQAAVLEVRLYAASPIRLTTANGALFLCPDGSVQAAPTAQSLRATEREITDAVLCACGYSLHSAQTQLAAGYLPLSGGHRLGVCGKAVHNPDGSVRTVTDVTALNLRIAHTPPDAAGTICRTLFRDGLCSPILAGPPLSGKTTMLRALADSLSAGRCGTFYRVSVLDTRREFSPLPYCDVLRDWDKADGIECALRVLSPQMIVCDEVADVREIAALERGFAAGCACAVSVHVGSERDLYTRAPLRALLATGQFTHVVLLDPSVPGRVKRICTPDAVCA